MRYNKIITGIAFLCLFSSSCSFGQFNTFINNFKNCSLPFITTASTFDIYHASYNRYVISETDFAKYLMMEGDTFISIKGSAPIGYHKYIAVGKFDIHNNFLGALYFRTIDTEDGDMILELMLCVFTKEGILLSVYPISGFYKSENIQFYSTIVSEENIEISFYNFETYDFISENVIEKKYLYITKKGLIQQR